MNLSATLSHRFNLIQSTAYFIRKHFLVVVSLSLIAAFGRVIQLGGFGAISTWLHIVLEVVIESARILLCIYVLGFANVKNGLLRIKRFFTSKGNRKQQWRTAVQKFKQQWISLVFNLILFMVIAWFFNYLIDQAAYETCFYLKLKEGGILVSSASEWTILLFLKNLSVIPFTLIFETLLLLWLTNKFDRLQHNAQPVY
ncbi:hypothetical protein [Xanthocytophaga agilis]|uniref:Uncharacterized protein n=1 Tax=Xanthocytophaga agilis TaxID=3048010 RepID=A0AAE3R4S2_9BACT|nr:hypothetical protein [Xanthocytophaga agilis]MDJ1503180.1 hypothetical protein [Xanthocytophaga agilis]